MDNQKYTMSERLKIIDRSRYIVIVKNEKHLKNITDLMI